MAVAMSDDPAAVVRALMSANLALAGRCAAQPEVLSRLDAEVAEGLRAALSERSRDPAADLRARQAAGRELGTLGDARFARRDGPYGAYLSPPLVELAAGEYVLGDDDAIQFDEQVWTDHQPRHFVRLEGYGIGRFMVTNAEWACFMAAGGYDDARWWDTPAGREWQSGVGTEAAAHANVRNWLAMFRANPDMPQREHALGRWSDEVYERYLRRLAMTPDELEAHLHETFPGQRKTEPQFWHDESCNRPSQPVIGVCWHEARAYCRWLAAQTGEPFRLLTEAEWEAAARGLIGRRHAYGDAFDPWRANTMETHLRQVAPIGIFPAGDTAEGVTDMAGNVYTWTSTAWGADPETPAFLYPYDAGDGREEPDAPPDMQRIIRGGSWYDSWPWSLAYARNSAYASDRRRISGVGVRLGCGATSGAV